MSKSARNTQIAIRKRQAGEGKGMWIGVCTHCRYSWRYWGWGATVGHGLEHVWAGCENGKWGKWGTRWRS